MPSFRKYKTKQGLRWLFKLELGIDPGTGKRKNTTRRGFLSKGDAEDACDLFKERLRNGEVYKDITIRELASKWREHYIKSGKRKEQTVILRTYQMTYLIHYFGYIQASNVTHLAYQQHIYDLKDKHHLYENTVKGMHSVAHMIFKFGVTEGYLKKDPTFGTELPTYPVEVVEVEEDIENSYFEKNEADEFMDAIKKDNRPDMYSIFFVLLWTGMRVGELIALEWTDIDLEEAEIRIRRTHVNTTNKTTSPKTKSSIRKISIEPEVVNILKEQKTRIKECSLLHPILRNNELVFPRLFGSKVGKWYSESIINQAMSKAQEICSFEKRLTPHKMRHTFTSLSAEAEIPLEDIKATLGHHDSKITEKIYMHVTKKRRKKISHRFGERMREKG